jgi:putative transposase
MPRAPRVILKCGTFHIALRGNNKKKLFYRDCEFRRFKSTLARYIPRQNISLYHYCLMKNHVHLAVKTSESTDLSRFMQSVELSYYHYHHRIRRYVGHLWQGRFISRVVDSDAYLLTSALYIERNPVDAGVVKSPENYPWSSYNHYAFGEKDALINSDPLYLHLGKTASERQKKYRDLMHNSIETTRTKKCNE